MGLINTTHMDMTQSLIDFQSDMLKNPFYLFNDKKALPTKYYNLNTSRSTLDKALKIAYSEIGPDCPLRWNLINDFYIYGIDRIATNLDNGEFGIESAEITGDAYILPGTIKPYPGDYFSIKMIKKNYLFKVTEVSNDTFDNGGNYWKIGYRLEYLDDDRLIPLIAEEFNFVSGNIGTNYSSVLKKTKWDVAKKLDDAAVALKKHYKGLYYNDKVQTYTFIYEYLISPTQALMGSRMYDPYMMEFIIKNKILANTGEAYNYIDHKTALRADFPIKYDRSIWKVLETREKDELSSCISQSSATYIGDPGTIFSTRVEDYFELTYNTANPVLGLFNNPLSILDGQVIGHILNNQLFDQNTKYAKYNMLIKYFNYENIGVEDIIPFERIIESDNNQENYFLIPMTIFVMEFYIKSMMSKVDE